jgi:predicted ATPase
MPPRAALPVPPTPLIGREHEVAAAQALLLSASETAAVRLLTLVGPGGVGKTRLAIEIVRTVQGSYVDGAAFVDLAPVRDQRLVPATVARVLGVREAGDRSAWELVLLHLRARQVLLVLDNFEHLPGAAPLLIELVGACPRVTLLVTSRTALRLRGEHRMPIGPLATPAADQQPPVADAAAYPAIRLFADRLGEVAPGFNIDDSNVTTVAEICRRLDGIPLALELAAAVSAPGRLRRWLDDRCRRGGLCRRRPTSNRRAGSARRADRQQFDPGPRCRCAEQRAALRDARNGSGVRAGALDGPPGAGP